MILTRCTIYAVLYACLIGLAFSAAAEGTKPIVCVLDGSEVQPMRDALKRLDISFRDLKALDAEFLTECRALVLCGTNPPRDEVDKQTILGFLNGGGAVLGMGGGAKSMIDHQLFDAKAYYLTGTTLHNTRFDGYHRLTFGYPGAKPSRGWIHGVPNMLRATEGPLMTLGSKATSIIGYGGGYSAGAFQTFGKGIVLLIGPDPQGGKMYYELGKPKMRLGDKLQTDRLLANAIAFLLDRHCNIIPNYGFEENISLKPQQSNWRITLAKGATKEWCKEGAPQGAAFLRLLSPKDASSCTVEPYCPIVVERGVKYKFACMYRSSATWWVKCDFVGSGRGQSKSIHMPEVPVAPSEVWTRFETELVIPSEGRYAKPSATVRGPGELCLDEVTLRRLPE